jgi:chemotaxis protein histidine kinase CheA
MTHTLPTPIRGLRHYEKVVDQMRADGATDAEIAQAVADAPGMISPNKLPPPARGQRLAAAQLAEHAHEIRRLGKQVVEDVIEIGSRLTECKALAGHGNWLPWLKREFGWTDKTAKRFMSVHALAGKFDNLSNLELPISGLYLISERSTPPEARAEVITRVEAGEVLAVAEVQRVITAHKEPATKKKRKPSAAQRKAMAETKSWWQENERQFRAAWQAEGRSIADYEAGLSNQKSEVWDWRRARGAAAIAAEEAAWLRDHPGRPLPKHLCSLNEAEGAEYDAWLKKYEAELTAPVVNGNDIDAEASAEARKAAYAAAEAVDEITNKPAAKPKVSKTEKRRRRKIASWMENALDDLDMVSSAIANELSMVDVDLLDRLQTAAAEFVELAQSARGRAGRAGGGK